MRKERRAVHAAMALATIILAGATAGCQSQPAPAEPEVDPSQAVAMQSVAHAMVPAAQARVEAFFGAPFPEAPKVTIAQDRAAFDAAFPEEWGMGKTQCWMVGVGVADFLVLLAPEDWPAEACDHDAKDEAHVREILTHELVHVYHGQNNPTRDFTGADEVGWFIEGLAVLASRDPATLRKQAGEAIAAGAAPARLEDAWSGKYRYPVAGSLAGYIDETWGRSKTVALLPVTTQAALLDALGLDEPTLLARWKAWAAASP